MINFQKLQSLSTFSKEVIIQSPLGELNEVNKAALIGDSYLRELISGPVQRGNGEEVKKIISTYAAKLSLIPLDKYSDFISDILPLL